MTEQPAQPKLRIAAAARTTPRTTVSGPPLHTVVSATPRPAPPDVTVVAQPQPVAPPPITPPPVVEVEPEPVVEQSGSQLRQWIGANLRIGQVACWQLALALAGLAIGRPWPDSGIAAVGALVLLALTAVRVHDRWLYEWARCRLKFQLRDRDRYLPREGGQRALLHLLAPDATVISIDDLAVVSRLAGATAVLRPDVADADPVAVLPMPESLLPANDDTLELGAQLVFHGISGDRRTPWAWVAVQAMRTPDLVDEDELTQALHNVVRRVLRQLAKTDLAVAGLDEAALMHTLMSLAHVSDRRSQVSEQWRHWYCGSINQAGFRVPGWADLEDRRARELLRALLTTNIGAVVTVAIAAGVADGVPAPERMVVRVAAPGADQLERSIGRLRDLAAGQEIRLDRMDGEHAAAVVASLPLGADQLASMR